MKQEPKTQRIVKGFLGYLSESHQGTLLPGVADELSNMVRTSRNDQNGEVCSAATLSVAQIERIGKLVKKYLGRDITLTQRIDKRLLGGFTVRIGDWFVDASLLRDVIQLKQAVLS